MYHTPAPHVVYQTCVGGAGCVAMLSMREGLVSRDKATMIMKLLGQAKSSLVTVIVNTVGIILDYMTFSY